METKLTMKEKKYAHELINKDKELQADEWPDWVGLVLFALGGLLAVSVCIITLGNLNPFSIKYVLFPGILIGMALILCGSFFQRMSGKSEEQKILRSLVKKLMAPQSGQ